MNNQAGFTLISFCIYLTMFAMLSFLSVLMMQRSYSMYKTRGVLNACVEDAYVAQDVFMHDLRLAPVDVGKWKHIRPDSIAWEVSEAVIQWSIENNMLVRTHVHKGKKQINGAVRRLAGGEFVVHVEGGCVHMASLTMRIRSVKGIVELQTAYGFYGRS